MNRQDTDSTPEIPGKGAAEELAENKAKKTAGPKEARIVARLDELETLPQRSAIPHWVVFTLSLLSLALLTNWMLGPREPVIPVLAMIDIGLGVVFAVEFFTRSGFRQERLVYLRIRFFDFIAIVPVLVLVQHGLWGEHVWIWVVLVARAARVVDRFLGDGFVRRNVLALVEGFEEEITDRVLERIITRIQADMDRAGFSHGIAMALSRNKESVLSRVRASTPRKGIVPELAHAVKLDAALERAEESTFDAVVKIIDSEEVDSAVRDVINSSFSRMRTELGEKTWRKHLGIRNRRAG